MNHPALLPVLFVMKKALSFLRELAANNNRDWFHAHKEQYQEALEEVRAFAAGMRNGILSFDPSLAGIDPRESIFRIYKDIRFSKDKTPYKTHFGTWMTRGGRKSTDAGYYFHLEPGGSFMAAGVHSPPKEQLLLIRQEILYEPKAYLKIINDPLIRNKYQRAGTEDMLKKGPAGFPKDFEYLEELKYKHYVFSKSYTDAEMLHSGFAETLTEDFRGLYPLVEYMNHAMSFTGNG